MMDAGLLSETFVALSDTLVAEFDVIDFLQMLTERSARLLPVSAAGVVLADPCGELRVAASSDETRLVELFQVQNEQGPCLECLRTGQPVTVGNLGSPVQRWPRFAAAATRAGFGSVYALPMRLRDQVAGALNLFSTGHAPLSRAELLTGQALADVATIGLLQERSVRRAEALAGQLQGALNSRVVIEQAKGRLAERLGVDVEQAFQLLRQHCRNTNQRLTDVARYIITSPTGEFPPQGRTQPPGTRRRHRPAG